MLAGEIVALIGKEPRYYQDVAGHFAEHDFQTVARALGRLHADGKLWQDPRGRLCLRDSAFAAKPPAKA
jgi:2,5-furandicarboxylate decarboxylase 1